MLVFPIPKFSWGYVPVRRDYQKILQGLNYPEVSGIYNFESRNKNLYSKSLKIISELLVFVRVYLTPKTTIARQMIF